MRRVVVLGRSGAGKSVASIRLGEITHLPVVELDGLFWRDDLTPTPLEDWVRTQRELAAPDTWIMDGDLGPDDAPAARLTRADTVVILDFSLARCAWRARRRSRERADFWWWLVTWRARRRPVVLELVARFAPEARLHILRTPTELRGFLRAEALAVHAEAAKATTAGNHSVDRPRPPT